MKLFGDKDALGDGSLSGDRVEPALGPLRASQAGLSASDTAKPIGRYQCFQGSAESQIKEAPQRTQSGVPILPLKPTAASNAGSNSWARLWAQRDQAPDPPKLDPTRHRNGKPASVGRMHSLDPRMIWSGEKPSRFQKTRRAFQVLSVLTVMCAIWFLAMTVSYTFKFPDPMALEAKGARSMRIVSREGSLLAERDGKHLYIPIGLLPEHVTNAVLAIEDRRFYEHAGVDLAGLLRAALANLRAGRYVQGGSTITQQLAKNMYLSPERTILRKLDELSLALWLEMRLEKRDILELYLNQVYFGGGAYGIEAAAQRHFGKSARALSVVESAIIAGLLKAPSRYSPSGDPAAARRRGRVVLKAMNAAGFLSAAELMHALAQPVRFAKSSDDNGGDTVGYATDYIFESLPALIGGGSEAIIVETTIDSNLQKLAQRQLRDTLRGEGESLNAQQGAVVVVDSSGGIRALVGGVDHTESQFNRATKAVRQPGSTFKPFVYLAALEKGMTPDSVALDAPLNFRGWSPRNSNGTYRGDVTLRDALASSINTVAVRLTLDVSPETVAATAHRAGISSDLRPEPSLALGTSEVNLLDLTAAYTLFANGGRRVEPYVIRRIVSSSGRVLYANASDNSTSLVDLRHVGAMNDMLNAALVAGTGRKAVLTNHPAAGKTGTSQDFRDAWFVGYTAHMTTGIWLGNDTGQPMSRVVGGGLPAKIWRGIMSEAHKPLAALPLPGTYRPGLRTPSDRDPAISGAGDNLSPLRDSRSTHAAATPHLPKKKSLAPIEPPPLPILHSHRQRNLIATRERHPEQSISSDFIAQAIEAVGSQPESEVRNVAGGSETRGFDLNEIRSRLEQAPDAGALRRPYMALGANPIRE